MGWWFFRAQVLLTSIDLPPFPHSEPGSEWDEWHLVQLPVTALLIGRRKDTERHGFCIVTGNKDQ